MGRWRSLVVVVALVAGLLAGAVGAATAAASPFTGGWTSVDVDGSNQRLAIGGGSSPRVLLYDDGATVCGGDPLIPARVSGQGSVSGTTLSVDFDVYCLARPTFFWGTAAFSFDYDSGTDTLTDSIGVVWSRAGS